MTDVHQLALAAGAHGRPGLGGTLNVGPAFFSPSDRGWRCYRSPFGKPGIAVTVALTDAEAVAVIREEVGDTTGEPRLAVVGVDLLHPGSVVHWSPYTLRVGREPFWVEGPRPLAGQVFAGSVRWPSGRHGWQRARDGSQVGPGAGRIEMAVERDDAQALVTLGELVPDLPPELKRVAWGEGAPRDRLLTIAQGMGAEIADETSIAAIADAAHLALSAMHARHRLLQQGPAPEAATLVAMTGALVLLDEALGLVLAELVVRAPRGPRLIAGRTWLTYQEAHRCRVLLRTLDQGNEDRRQRLIDTVMGQTTRLF